MHPTGGFVDGAIRKRTVQLEGLRALDVVSAVPPKLANGRPRGSIVSRCGSRSSVFNFIGMRAKEKIKCH